MTQRRPPRRVGPTSPKARDDTYVTAPLLDRAPELAVLALLDKALHVAGHALLAAQPALLGDPPPWRVTAELRAAERVVRRAATLGQAVERYRRCILRTLEKELLLEDAAMDDRKF